MDGFWMFLGLLVLGYAIWCGLDNVADAIRGD